MKCSRCGSDIESGWNFCPRCGARRNADPADALGRDIFSRMLDTFKNSFSDFDQMEKVMEKDMETFDLSKFAGRKTSFRPVRIQITQKAGQPPRVTVNNYKNKARSVGPALRGDEGKIKKPRMPSFMRRKVEVTEEPDADVRRAGDRLLVDIKMPEVKNREDVTVNDFDSSVEIKALAGKKGYFKIVKKPENFRLSSKSFDDGVLHLEFS